MVTILYFSPTGNTRYIAYKLREILGEEPTSIDALDHINPLDIQITDHIAILFSIHGFNPPRIVKHFVNRLPVGLCTTISLIAVGCAESWVNQAATFGLRKNLEKKGYTITADRVIAMPLTFIKPFPFEAGKKLVMEVDDKVRIIADDIRLKKRAESRVERKSRFINLIGKLENPASRMFGLELHANKKCVSCGLCEKECPAGNIHLNKKGKPIFHLKCMMCLRCVYNCPEKAISPWTAKFIPIKGGYDITEYLEHDE